MATRSTIALEYANGQVDRIYCHWDGYLDNNGEILFRNYQDPFEVQKLMDLGDMSSLSETVDGCEFYMRDRHETGCKAIRYESYEQYRKEADFEEYNYILRRDGKWYVEFYGKFDGLLEEAFTFNAEEVE